MYKSNSGLETLEGENYGKEMFNKGQIYNFVWIKDSTATGGAYFNHYVLTGVHSQLYMNVLVDYVLY